MRRPLCESPLLWCHPPFCALCRSDDNKFILKTITHSEVRTLLELLPAYIAYVRVACSHWAGHDTQTARQRRDAWALCRHLSERPQSLLVRFYGCFAVKAHHAGSHYYVLMSNVMPVQVKMTELYDLKFSTVSRSVPQAVQARYKAIGKTPVLKDEEFRHR